MRITFASLILMFNLSGLAPAQNRRPYMPDPKLTPGASLDVSREDLCKPEYISPDRKIPIAVKCQVFDRYGKNPDEVGYNVDHLIPISLGGSNSLENLWPQSLSVEWSYAMKNTLERTLFKRVCRGELDLKKAQQEIAADWVSAYKKYVVNGGGGL
jgi:hypothetical protein